MPSGFVKKDTRGTLRDVLTYCEDEKMLRSDEKPRGRLFGS
jgi:hypothetical protein